MIYNNHIINFNYCDKLFYPKNFNLVVILYHTTGEYVMLLQVTEYISNKLVVIESDALLKPRFTIHLKSSDSSSTYITLKLVVFLYLIIYRGSTNWCKYNVSWSKHAVKAKKKLNDTVIHCFILVTTQKIFQKWNQHFH